MVAAGRPHTVAPGERRIELTLVLRYPGVVAYGWIRAAVDVRDEGEISVGLPLGTGQADGAPAEVVLHSV